MVWYGMGWHGMAWHGVKSCRLVFFLLFLPLICALRAAAVLVVLCSEEARSERRDEGGHAPRGGCFRRKSAGESVDRVSSDRLLQSVV